MTLTRFNFIRNFSSCMRISSNDRKALEARQPYVSAASTRKLRYFRTWGRVCAFLEVLQLLHPFPLRQFPSSCLSQTRLSKLSLPCPSPPCGTFCRLGKYFSFSFQPASNFRIFRKTSFFFTPFFNLFIQQFFFTSFFFHFILLLSSLIFSFYKLLSIKILQKLYRCRSTHEFSQRNFKVSEFRYYKDYLSMYLFFIYRSLERKQIGVMVAFCRERSV